MSCELVICVEKVAPLYNLALTAIVYILLIYLIRMKKRNKKVFIKPWYYLFAAISMFVLEEIITALKFLEVIPEAAVPRWFNAVFELFMAIFFIYMLFLQIEHVSQKYKKKKNK